MRSFEQELAQAHLSQLRFEAQFVKISRSMKNSLWSRVASVLGNALLVLGYRLQSKTQIEQPFHKAFD